MTSVIILENMSEEEVKQFASICPETYFKEKGITELQVFKTKEDEIFLREEILKSKRDEGEIQKMSNSLKRYYLLLYY